MVPNNLIWAFWLKSHSSLNKCILKVVWKEAVQLKDTGQVKGWLIFSTCKFVLNNTHNYRNQNPFTLKSPQSMKFQLIANTISNIRCLLKWDLQIIHKSCKIHHTWSIFMYIHMYIYSCAYSWDGQDLSLFTASSQDNHHKTVCFLVYIRQYSVLRTGDACANFYGWEKQKFLKHMFPVSVISGCPPTSSVISKNHGTDFIQYPLANQHALSAERNNRNSQSRIRASATPKGPGEAEELISV